MAEPAKNWAYTDFTADKSVRLVIETDISGVTGNVGFEVAQFTASFAINQVPEAVCMLAMGRNAADVTKLAATHKSVASLKQMRKAQVFLIVSGDYNTTGKEWPDRQQMIFDGYLTGLSFQKINGKVNLVANLIHWLVDMSFSSCLSSVSHVSNPAFLASPAVHKEVVPSAGASQTHGEFIGSLVGSQQIYPLFAGDTWLAVKTLLCSVSQYEGFVPPCPGGLDPMLLKQNRRATRALTRIEGPGPGATSSAAAANPTLIISTDDCGMTYKYGKALPLKLGDVRADQALANGLMFAHATDLWNMTLWDLMVGSYCPTLSMSLCPGVDRAIVVADLPCWRGLNGNEMWRTITLNEFEFFDQTAMIPRPLRAVVVHGQSQSDTGVNLGSNADGTGGNMCVTGVYVSDAEQDAGGVVMYTQMPAWIAMITASSANAGKSGIGITGRVPPNSAITHDTSAAPPPEKVPAQLATTAQKVAGNYARSLFIKEALRGRSGTISGKLRFDIAPGSHVKLQASPEPFIAGEDQMAEDLYAQVNRVTIEINSESRRAATAFVLTHLRNAAENAADRTSADEHPFYGDAIVPGFPLVPAYEFPQPTALPAILGQTA